MSIPHTISEHLGYIITPTWPTDFKLHNGDVIVQLSNKAGDLLIVHSDVLSKHSHYLACYLSPRWQTQATARDKDGSEKQYWRYHDGEKMMEYYATLHRALFTLIYGHDLCFFPTTSTGTMSEFLADLFALSDFYGTNQIIGPLVQKMLWEDAEIGGDICKQPAFYIALAQTLECRELLLESIKHAAGKERSKGGRSYCGGDLAAVSDETGSLIRIAQDQIHGSMVEVYNIIINAIIMTGEEQIRKYLKLPVLHESYTDDEADFPSSTSMQVYHTIATAVGVIAQYIPYTAAYHNDQWQRASDVAQGVVLKVVVQRLWRPGHDSDYLPQGADVEFIYNLTQNSCWSERSLFPPDLLRPIATQHRIAEALLTRAIGETLSRINGAYCELPIWRVCRKYMQEDDRDLLDYHLTDFARSHKGQDLCGSAADVLNWWAPRWPRLRSAQDIDAVARAEHEFADHFASLDLLRDSTIKYQPFDRWRSVIGDPDIVPFEIAAASRGELAQARVAYFGYEGVTGRLEDWNLAQWPLFQAVLEAAK